MPQGDVRLSASAQALSHTGNSAYGTADFFCFLAVAFFLKTARAVVLEN
jgi:hypothetical protein